MDDQIKLLIVDDHAVVREGIRALISSRTSMQILGEAENGAEAVQKAILLKPNVILMDLVMPGKDGIQAIKEIKNELPDVRILVLTSFAEDDKVFPAIKAGAAGYLLKDSSPKELIQAIQDVFHGESSLHPMIARKLIQELHKPSDLPPASEPLTAREAEVLRFVAQGFSNQDIAARLNISEWTVRTHISNILSKLHLANRTQATLYAIKEGLINS